MVAVEITKNGLKQWVFKATHPCPFESTYTDRLCRFRCPYTNTSIVVIPSHRSTSTTYVTTQDEQDIFDGVSIDFKTLYFSGSSPASHSSGRRQLAIGGQKPTTNRYADVQLESQQGLILQNRFCLAIVDFRGAFYSVELATLDFIFADVTT